MTYAAVSPRVPRRTLLGPGPSDVAPSVLEALARPLVGHLDPFFVKIMSECQDMLRQVFETSNQVTFPVSGTGSAGMGACLVNLIEPRDRVLVAACGVFGGRLAEVATRCGAEVATITRPFGETFSLSELRAALERQRPKLLAIVHAETSTGALQDLSGLAAACREVDALLVVDCVTSLGGLSVALDRQGIDAAYSGSQKCLSCPPGLAPVSFGPRAVAALKARKTPVASWYLDASMVMRYWGEERFYHHTAPISMIYALHEALRLVLEEGLETRFARHRLAHRALRAGLTALGLSYVPSSSLPMLNAVRIPAGADDLRTRRELLETHGIEIGGGLGELKGKAWRIGLMGYGARRESVLSVLGALGGSLAAQGLAVSPTVATAAAAEVYAAEPGARP